MNTLISTLTPDAALAEVNKLRKANKGKWLFLQVEIPDKPPLLVKFFNTSIQVLRKNDIRYSDGWDLSVKDFSAKIFNALVA